MSGRVEGVTPQERRRRAALPRGGRLSRSHVAVSRAARAQLLLVNGCAVMCADRCSRAVATSARPVHRRRHRAFRRTGQARVASNRRACTQTCPEVPDDLTPRRTSGLPGSRPGEATNPELAERLSLNVNAVICHRRKFTSASSMCGPVSFLTVTPTWWVSRDPSEVG